MNAGEDSKWIAEVSEAEARKELDRLLSDPRFHATERAKNLLRYIAARYFEGDTEGVKAYAIALDVLGRPPRFDPNSDPIVRIEVSRLRSALSTYYEAYGDELDIGIHLPIGHYLTVFTRSVVIARPTEEEMAEADRFVDQAATESRLPLLRRLGRYGTYRSSMAVLVLAALAAGWAWTSNRPTLSERPAVTLTISAADEDYSHEAEVVGNYLVSAMSQFRTLDISAEKAIPTASVTRALRPPRRNSYDIELKYYADEDDRSVWWQVVDSRTGSILKSGVERTAADGRSAAAARDEVVSVLAKRFATTRGVINNLETHSDRAMRSLGNTCVLRAEYELDEGTQEDIMRAGQCLERTIQIRPNDSDAAAALARVLAVSLGGDLDSPAGARALSLANTAVSVAPSSDRAYLALMTVQFYRGNTEAAIEAGNRALRLNPNNPEVLAKLAAVLFSSGYRNAAVSLAEDAGRNIEAVPRDARLVLALDAYSRGDFSNASLLAEQMPCGDFLVRALRAAALGEIGSAAAGERLALLREALPDFQHSFASRMQQRRYRPELIASIQDGLQKAMTIAAPAGATN
ncbi:tetratricopeptide repeat protein [Neorhizobium sp. DT-125]|uniref:tetratricopeptide repeat protein n=1 Tax=Neorhizobium sp. DT-125 TaxID=3396163 RepID=UPI003F1A450B